METKGTLQGLNLQGTFAGWRRPNEEREDEKLGIRTQRTLRIGDVEFVQNENGDVRVLRGLVARRQVTEDFVDSGAFAQHPEADVLIGPAKLYDGRDVIRVRVVPLGGEPYVIALDASTHLVDEKSYQDGDSTATVDYSDYRVVDGALVPYVEVDSSGDHAYDITSRVDSVAVDRPIDASIFAPLVSTVIDAPAPVTVPVLADGQHFFVRARVDGHSVVMLLDTGAQGVFLDVGTAKRLGLTLEGMLEVRGAKRTSGAGVAALDRIEIGDAHLPVGVVSVVDLSSVTFGGYPVDGVLGYPFFAAAEVRVDPDKLVMTIAKPGTLPAAGSPLTIDTDRELPETQAKIGSIEGRFLLDTGNGTELLLFHAFVKEHPNVIVYQRAPFFSQNRGVGGSSAAVRAMVTEIDLGPFRLFNRIADVMLAETGAFADRNDAGNIGLGSLRNFTFTFDYVNRTLYLERARGYDDGRGRTPEMIVPSEPNVRPPK